MTMQAETSSETRAEDRAETLAEELAAAAAPSSDAESAIDLARFPISDLGSPEARDLIARLRADLAADGCAVLEGFVRPEAVARIQEEGRALSSQAYTKQRFTNPYSCKGDPELPDSHPINHFMERTNGFVGGDLIAPETTLRRLYHDPRLKALLEAVLGIEGLREHGDPIAGLVVNVLRPGCQHPWHFDNNYFTVSLLTQPAEAGGLFEYAPALRTDETQNYDAVQAVLEGRSDRVKALDLKTGDLQIFHGRHSLHRVSPVEGERERHTAILSYTDKPDQIADPERTRRLFGRVSEAHEKAARDGRAVAAHRASDGEG